MEMMRRIRENPIILEDIPQIEKGGSVLITGLTGSGKTAVLNSIVDKMVGKDTLVAINSEALLEIMLERCKSFVVLKNDWNEEDINIFNKKLDLAIFDEVSIKDVPRIINLADQGIPIILSIHGMNEKQVYSKMAGKLTEISELSGENSDLKVSDVFESHYDKVSKIFDNIFCCNMATNGDRSFTFINKKG